MLAYIKNNLIDSDGNMYFTVDFLIEKNNRIAKLAYSHVDLTKLIKLIEYKLYQIANQFSQRKLHL